MRRKTTRDDRVIEVKVDSMSTCQLANINTGEQLYLKVGKKSGEDTDPKTLVELTVFGMTGKISQSFSNSVSLLGIVADLVCEKKIDESVLLKDPEMVLVGKGITYKGDMLQTTTLKSLFLYGQRASFHLNHSSDFSLSYPRDEELESALEEAIIALKTVSEITLRTLLSYVDNVLSNPSEKKYRTIKMSNKAFKERISAVDGAHKVLTIVGFQNTLIIGSGEPEIFLGGAVDGDVISRLRIAEKCLKDALQPFGESNAKLPRVQRESKSSPSSIVQFPGKGRRVDGNEITPEKQSSSSETIDLTQDDDYTHGGANKRKRIA